MPGSINVSKTTSLTVLLLILLAVGILTGAAACRRPLPTAAPQPTVHSETEVESSEGKGMMDGSASPYWSGPTVWEPEDIDSLERVTQDLVAPPFLPKHDQEYPGEPRVVEVRMVVEEKELEIAPGEFIWAFTFNGSVPGPS